MAEYEILGKLGEGGFGTTFLAENTIGQRFALKGVRDEDEALKEAERLIEIKHRNIVDVVEVVGPDDVIGRDVRRDRHYIVMEYLDGKTLAHYLSDHKSLSPPAWWRLLSPILDGIRHMHANDVVHRDIKPDNIIIKLEDGILQPIVIDVGLATAVDIFDGVVGGTECYRPPEWRDPHSIGPRYDIYQLALVSYEAMFGYLSNFKDMQNDLREDGSPFMSALAKGLEQNVDDRPQSIWDWVISMVAPPRTLGVERYDDTANTLSYVESGSSVVNQSSEEQTGTDETLAQSLESGRNVAVTGNTSVAELRHEIERDFGLPTGCIAILRNPANTRAHAGGGLLLRTLRDDLYSSDIEEGENLRTLARKIGERYGLPEGSIRFLRRGTGPMADRLIDRGSLVSTMRTIWQQ